MIYETAAQMAERLGVTPRRVQLWAKEGKLPGAIKQGRDWMIPFGMDKPKKGLVIHTTCDVSLPLLAGSMDPGTIADTIAAMEDGDEKLLSLAEYYYFTGNAEKAIAETELFFNHKDVVTKVSACLIYSFASIALGQRNHAAIGFACIEESLKTEVDLEHVTPRQKAMCKLIGATVDVLVHRKSPDAELTEYMKYLPRGLQVWACCIMAHIAFLDSDYNRALGITDTIVSISTRTYPVVMTYLNITNAMCYMELKQIEKAKLYLKKAWELAQKDRIFQPFAEHHSLLCGLVETCLKRPYPNEYNEIAKLAQSFTSNWRKLYNAQGKGEIATSLTTTEFAISMLACRGWSNQEIADYMELSLHTVKRYISIVYQKLSITSRAELKQHMH